MESTLSSWSGWPFIGGIFGGIGISILSAIIGFLLILSANYGASTITILEYASWFSPAILAIVGGVLGVRAAKTRQGKWGVVIGVIVPALFLAWYYGREALG